MRLISRFLPRLPDDDCGNATDDGEHQAASKEVKPGHGEHQDEKSGQTIETVAAARDEKGPARKRGSERRM